MIELGRLKILDASGFNASRRKMLQLIQSLDFDPLLSSKLTSLFSELARLGEHARPGENRGTEIALYLDRHRGASALAVQFTYGRKVVPNVGLAFFFDDFQMEDTDGVTRLRLCKYLPDDEFWPDDDFLDRQREMLALPSREELLSDLKRKNLSLKQEMAERRKAEEERRQRLEELTRARWAMLNIMEDIDEARKTAADALEIISGSINYASHIQQAILPDETLFNRFSDHFILWEPRDVVGGDIYWSVPWNGGLLLALGDCTGHGVPGAFMTLITTAALDRAKSEAKEMNIAGIVARMHQLVQRSLNQHQKEGTSDDGMELGLCYLNDAMREMIFVGTRFPLFVVENGDVTEVKGDRKAIGYRSVPHDQQYTERRIQLRPGRRFYMTSDGLLDQVGGPKRRGFGKKRFKQLLLSLTEVPMKQHSERISEALLAYQGRESRRDDVALLGFQI
jgi:serine phosphatase RsbU (regulator of sigma subunit)